MLVFEYVLFNAPPFTNELIMFCIFLLSGYYHIEILETQTLIKGLGRTLHRRNDRIEKTYSK